MAAACLIIKNKQEGKIVTAKEFADKYSDNELKDLAESISKTIEIRSYKNGSSVDMARKSSLPEKEIIKKIAYASMLSYNRESSDIDSILYTAEFTLVQFIPDANGYDSIYIPLRKVTET